MLAFLKEMKSVKLRKVSLGSSTAPPSANTSFSGLPVPTGPALLKRPSSSSTLAKRPSVLDSRAGNKRKRPGDGLAEFQDDLRQFFCSAALNLLSLVVLLGMAIKRRSLGSSDLSFASTSTSGNSSFSSQSQPYQRLNIPTRNWPSTSTVSASATTPSLCSDNDLENDNKDVEDDGMPSTPPISAPTPPFRTAFRFKENGIPVEDDNRRMSISRRMEDRSVIDMEEEEGGESMAPPPPPPPPPPPAPPLPAAPSQPQPSASRARQPTDLFASRPPSSPLPASPLRPRAPARARTVSMQRRRLGASDEEEDLDVELEEREGARRVPVCPSRIPRMKIGSGRHGTGQARGDVEEGEVSQGSVESTSLPGRTRKGKRRVTLDEELQAAWDEDGESGVLVGVGMSKRRGFLAHGGAGGVPVFMGEGYVREVVVSDEEDEDEGGRDYDDDEYLP